MTRYFIEDVRTGMFLCWVKYEYSWTNSKLLAEKFETETDAVNTIIEQLYGVYEIHKIYINE